MHSIFGELSSNSAFKNYSRVNKVNDKGDLLALTLFDDIQVTPVSDSAIKNYSVSTKVKDEGQLDAFTLLDSIQVLPVSNNAIKTYSHATKVNAKEDLIALTLFDDAQVTPVSDKLVENYSNVAKIINRGNTLGLKSFDSAQVSTISLPHEKKKSDLQNYSKSCRKLKKSLKKKFRMYELPTNLQGEKQCKRRITARPCRQKKKSSLESLKKVKHFSTAVRSSKNYFL